VPWVATGCCASWGRCRWCSAATPSDCVSTRHDFIGRARDRPGQFLVCVAPFACQHGRLAGDKRVCSNSFEQFQSTSADRSGGTSGSPRSGNLKMTDNKIRVLIR
jgi:hypothetical protein